MQVLFITANKIEGLKAAEKECKVTVTRINKLETPATFKAYEKAFKYLDDGAVEELKPGIYYYFAIGRKERLQTFADSFDLIPEGNTLEELQVIATKE